MLAERLGVSFQAVSRWEREETYPDIAMLSSIANFFGVTVDTLLGTAEEKEEQEVEQIIRECQEYDRHYDIRAMDEYKKMIEKLK